MLGLVESAASSSVAVAAPCMASSSWLSWRWFFSTGTLVVSASSRSTDRGSGSYSTVTSSAASSAAPSVSASTATTGWPTCIVRSKASRMSRASDAASGLGIGRSRAVRMATTPGTSLAADVSTLTIVAEAYGLRTKRVNSAPGGNRSFVKRVRPVSRSGESARRWRRPMWVVCPFVPFCSGRMLARTG